MQKLLCEYETTIAVMEERVIALGKNIKQCKDCEQRYSFARRRAALNTELAALYRAAHKIRGYAVKNGQSN